jgi:hypothetical protein
MCFIAVALLLLALVAGTHLLSKSKSENRGKFSEWVAYAVIIVSILMLLCQLCMCTMRMMHRGDRHEMREHHMGMMQYCPPEMCGGVPCMMPMGRGGMNCCRMGGNMHGCKMEGGMKGEMDCCKGEMKHGGEEHKGKCCDEMEDDDDRGEGMKKDSVK